MSWTFTGNNVSYENIGNTNYGVQTFGGNFPSGFFGNNIVGNVNFSGNTGAVTFNGTTYYEVSEVIVKAKGKTTNAGELIFREINIKGDPVNVNTTSGTINVDGNIGGYAQATSGTINAKIIGGSVGTTSGSVKADEIKGHVSTISGTIRRK